MAPLRTVEITPHTAIGVSLALLGVVLTLDNLGFVDARDVLKFWALIPMVVGAAYVVQGGELREWLVGAAWMAAGTAFLLRSLGVFHFSLWDFLPLLLVALGVRVILGRSRGGPAGHAEAGNGLPPFPGMPGMPMPPPPPPGFGSAPTAGPSPHGYAPGRTDVVRVFAMLWGADRRVRGPVSHVEVSAVMGGCDVDLRDAVASADPLVLQVFAMWGGIEIRVPHGWLVQNEAWPILGGIVDNTSPAAGPTHRVILRGNAFMGGVEVKN